MLSLNEYRNDYRLTMNYQGVSRVRNIPRSQKGTITYKTIEIKMKCEQSLKTYFNTKT